MHPLLPACHQHSIISRPLSSLQMYKLVEELGVAVAASVPACLLIFYLVRLQGSLALFWLVNLVSAAVSTGGRRALQSSKQARMCWVCSVGGQC